LRAVDRGFEPWLGQTKDNEIGICCFSAKHAALRRKTGWLRTRIICPSGTTLRSKSKDWLARNQNNVESHVFLQTVISVS
jgi:hypothetical protein